MSERSTVLLLIAAGALLRVVIGILFYDDLIVTGDQMANILLANKVASGNLYEGLDTYWPPVYPFLVGAVRVLVPHLVAPAIIVSVLTGTLAVLLTYLLARQAYGHRVAVVAGLLAVFFPHLINSVFWVGSENIYLVWIVSALLIFWKGLEKSGVLRFLITGFLLGVAYLTRPEAFLYPFFFLAVLILYALRSASGRPALLKASVALVLGFFALAAPYLVYLRSETGRWTISAKVEVNTIATGFSEPKMAASVESTSSSVGTAAAYTVAMSRLIASNVVLIGKIVPILIPFFLAILIGLGLFGKPWSKERIRWELFLMSFCVLTTAGYALAVTQLRYFFLLLPIVFGWTALGIINLQGHVIETAKSTGWGRVERFARSKAFIVAMLLGICLYTSPLFFFVTSEKSAWQEHGYEQRDAGLWLKANAKPSPLVFSAVRTPVFYAEAEQIAPETTDIQQILATIYERSVDYVITSDRSLHRHPYIEPLEPLLRNSTDFSLVYESEPREGYRVSIYAFKGGLNQ